MLILLLFIIQFADECDDMVHHDRLLMYTQCFSASSDAFKFLFSIWQRNSENESHDYFTSLVQKTVHSVTNV